MAGGRYFKRKRRPRRHFGKLVGRKYVKRRFRKRPRRTATRRALGLTSYGISQAFSHKPFITKAIGADNQPLGDVYGSQVAMDGKTVKHWYQSINALLKLPEVKYGFDNYGEFRLRGVGVQRDLHHDTTTEVYNSTVNDSAKPFEWAFRPMRQYDQFLDTFDFDQYIGDRKRIPENFTALKQFPETTFRMSYADKAIRWYIKWPMWNAEYSKNKVRTWGTQEYPLYPQKPYMWHSTDYITSHIEKLETIPLSFIFGQFCLRYADPIVDMPTTLRFNLTYYFEFRKRKMPSNEAFSTGKYPGTF